jgi:hypothetical protein
MAYIKSVFSSLLKAVLPKEAFRPLLESGADRIDHDLTGLSDMDALWYYEKRKWRGRD